MSAKRCYFFSSQYFVEPAVDARFTNLAYQRFGPLSEIHGVDTIKFVIPALDANMQVIYWINKWSQ